MSENTTVHGHQSAPGSKGKPTIAELERILKEEDRGNVYISPSGEVVVDPPSYECTQWLCTFPKGHEGPCRVRIDIHELEFNYLIGKLKTIIDASTTDPVQRKAQKDLVALAVWDFVDQRSGWHILALRKGEEFAPRANVHVVPE